MKRFTIVAAALAIMVSGAAFAGEKAGAGKETTKMYNGITYFETSAESNCSGSSAVQNTVTAGSDKQLSNGITFFDAASTVSRANCAGRSNLLASTKQPFNGITVF